MVLFRIEHRDLGDEQIDVPQDKIVGEINRQVANGKWPVVENKDGSSELITAPVVDVNESDDEDEAPDTAKSPDWKNAFPGTKGPDFQKIDPANVKQVVSTNKMKGG